MRDPALGECTEDAIGGAAGESERVERLLKNVDIVAVKMRKSQIEHTVAEREARIDESGPRIVSDRTITCERVLGLKRPDRLRGRAEEHPVDAGATEVIAQHEQAPLYVFDCGSPVSGPHCFHRLVDTPWIRC